MAGSEHNERGGGAAALSVPAVAGAPTAGRPLAARIKRHLDVLAVLAKSDLQLRYGRGGFRFLKWLLDPLAALGVYLLLIELVLGRSSEHPALSIACAIVPFQLIATTMSNALQSVSLRSSIIVNMQFPRSLIPASSLATESVAFPATLAILPVLMIVSGVAPTAALLWLPVALAVTAAFALALAYPAALLGVWYPELQPFAGSVVRAMFFIAPGLVALDQLGGTARELLPFNPLSGIFETFRDIFLYGQSPEAWQLLAPIAAAALLLAIALPIYRADEDSLAKLVG